MPDSQPRACQRGSAPRPGSGDSAGPERRRGRSANYEVPAGSAPGREVPAGNVRGSNVPAGSTPKSSTPKSSTPEGSTPGSNVPVGKVLPEGNDRRGGNIRGCPGHSADHGPAPRRRTGPLGLLLACLVLVASLAGCAGGSSDTPGAAAAPAGGQVLNLYAFSVAKPGFEALAKAYATTPEGAKVTVLSSYGASGDQSRKVVAGAPADVVSFSITPDLTRLVNAGMVDASWSSGAYHGTPVTSVVVMVVRTGNPKDIHDWSDLLRPGIDVVTPNPLSSGSAQWNLLAPYAATSHGGQDKQAGLDYVRSLVHDHVSTRPSSGSDATETFRQGHGDVLLSYENEAIAAIGKGDDVEYVVPQQTVRIEAPLAAVSTSPHQEAAQRFVDFAATPAGQEVLARVGYRPVDPTVAAAHAAGFPPLGTVWTVADLGGWNAVTSGLFAKDTGAITAIYSEATR